MKQPSAPDAISPSESGEALYSRFVENRDQEAFHQLMARYSRRMLGTIQNNLSNEDDVQEILQESWYQLSLGRPIEGSATFEQCAMRIAYFKQ
jgi:hypothetical protein